MCKCNNSCNGNCSRNLPCPPEGVTPHPHAELMIQYAQDATETRSPELLWEYRTSTGQDWKQCIDCPTWQPAYQYRRKPSTININGYEVPEPVRKAPTWDTKYWYPSLIGGKLADFFTWGGDSQDCAMLDRGLMHLTRKAAELHAKALLSFTKKE